MKLPFMLKMKAWQLYVTSAFLLFAPFFMFKFGLNSVKLGLIIWFIYNQLYLSTIGFGLKHKIPPDLNISFNIFSFAIILNTTIFALFICFVFGSNWIMDNPLMLFGGSIILFIAGTYTVLFILRVIFIAENGKDVYYGDLFGEVLKIGFKFFGFYDLHKRVQKLL